MKDESETKIVGNSRHADRSSTVETFFFWFKKTFVELGVMLDQVTMMRIASVDEQLSRGIIIRAGDVRIYHESPKHSFWDVFINTKMQQEEFDEKARAAWNILGGFLCVKLCD